MATPGEGRASGCQGWGERTLQPPGTALDPAGCPACLEVAIQPFRSKAPHLKQTPGLPLSLSLSQPHSFLGTAAGQPLPREVQQQQQQQPWGQERLPASKFSPGRLASPPFALGNNEPAPAHLPAAEGHPRPAAPPHWGQMSPPGQQTRPGRLLPGGRGRRQPGPPARGALRMPCGSCPLDGGGGGLVLSLHPRPASAKANGPLPRPASLRRGRETWHRPMAARILSSSLWPAQGSRWDVTASTERLRPLEPGSRAKSLGRAWGTAVTAPSRDGDGHVGRKATSSLITALFPLCYFVICILLHGLIRHLIKPLV